MARYVVSFNDGAMDHIPDEDWPDVGKASHAVVQDAVNAGVFVFGAGIERQRASVVATDGTVTDVPHPQTGEFLGGFVIIDVAAREEALSWAARFADACRCAQEVRELMPDPETDAMLRRADR
ncbi:YciI family protein [Micromonospora sp. NPDC047074]|uniref:YciI family protein n=1 Tax=Micromonospora sp. NPDC047074 TaxID=3154339 RepID=UPI0033EE06E3